MLELDFQVEGAEPERFAAAPLLLFKLRVREVTPGGLSPTPVHSVMLRCQIRIEPARRRYAGGEPEKLLDLFGTLERWGQTLRPFPWTHASAAVPAFTGSCLVDLPVACTFDFA